MSARPLLPAFPDGAWPDFPSGTVWLAGAGPGDPGLVTLHTVNALSRADVVVTDALANEEILGWARPGARIERAGKRGGRPSPRQEEITHRLIALAREGQRVLRLKGGDPFVFGRGGEEAEALILAGVPVRVTPGVTAGIGGLAYAGIPVTHRAVNQAVTFVTGHDRNGGVPADLDWPAIARGSPVIVLYMAMRHLDRIAGALLAAGRDPAEPVAIVAEASLPAMRRLDTTLGRAAADAEASGIRAPAIVCIGGVAALAGALDWLATARAGPAQPPLASLARALADGA